jgi:hypothetical protein
MRPTAAIRVTFFCQIRKRNVAGFRVNPLASIQTGKILAWLGLVWSGPAAVTQLEDDNFVAIELRSGGALI